MSQKTNIEWATHTSSPWFGCTEVDPCCANCYARELTIKSGWAGWGDNSPRVKSKGFWKDVYKWNRAAQGLAVPPRTFTSLMDWLDDKVPIEWFNDFLDVIRNTPNLNHMLLTKRPELWKSRMQQALALRNDGNLLESGLARWIRSWLAGEAPHNVWFGYTGGTSKTWNERYWIVRDIPARVRWCSAEPLLENLFFSDILQDPECPSSHFLDLVVIGGESGSRRRNWDGATNAIVNLAKSAKLCRCKVFVKQDCALKPGQQGGIPDDIWALKELPE